MSYIFFAALLSFVLALIFVPCAKMLAQWLRILDVPDGKIKLHHKATPYLGGLAVYFSFTIALIILFPYLKSMLSVSSDLYFLLGCFLLVIVGLVDDMLVLSPAQKFLGQCFACLSFLYSGCYVYVAWAPFIGLILSGLWILTIINAFNLIDVMDGLSSTIAILSALGFMNIALYQGEMLIACMLASLIGALTGFLFYNYPPASIYMGDAGSLFIGGILASLPLKLHFSQFSLSGYLAPVIILAIPLLELTSLIIIRAYKRIPFYNGSPDHFSMYLQQHGWSKTLILFYVSFMMIVCISSVCGLVASFINLYQIIFLAIIFLIVWFIILIRGSLRLKKC